MTLNHWLKEKADSRFTWRKIAKISYNRTIVIAENIIIVIKVDMDLIQISLIEIEDMRDKIDIMIKIIKQDLTQEIGRMIEMRDQ